MVGADILERVRFPYPVVPIVRSHHEAWDGSGYPDGLKGEHIPIGARILSAIDCFDALASDRPYREALSAEQAIDYIVANAGIKFDPTVVRLLATHCREWEEKTHRQNDTIAHLKTVAAIPHGLAPAAGFAAISNPGEVEPGARAKELRIQPSSLSSEPCLEELRPV